MKVERSRHGFVGLEILESHLLESAVGRNIECVRLAEKPLELQLIKVDIDALAHALRANASATSIGVDKVQMHVRFITKGDLVGGREANRVAILKPDHHEDRPALDR